MLARGVRTTLHRALASEGTFTLESEVDAFAPREFLFWSGVSTHCDAGQYRIRSISALPVVRLCFSRRTQLAWWRTAFAILAVGLAIGKIIPQLASAETIWPYTVLGAGFGIYAVVLTIHGSRRRERVEQAVETGESFRTSRQVQALLTGGATLLALATTVMIIFN